MDRSALSEYNLLVNSEEMITPTETTRPVKIVKKAILRSLYQYGHSGPSGDHITLSDKLISRSKIIKVTNSDFRTVFINIWASGKKINKSILLLPLNLHNLSR